MDGFLEQNYLSHHGILGMKWGVRRYQNSDGSLTSAGKSRYGVGEGRKKTVTNDSKGTYKRGKVDTKTSAKESAMNAGGGRYTKTFAKINEANVAGGANKGDWEIDPFDDPVGNDYKIGGVSIKIPQGMDRHAVVKLLNGVGFSSFYEAAQIGEYAKAKGFNSLTLDPSGYVDGFPFTVFAELKEGSTYDQMFPFANVKPENAAPQAMTDEEYAMQDLAVQRLLTENDSVSKIQKAYDETLKKRQKYEKLLASVKEQGAYKKVIRNYENEIAALDEELWYYDKIRKKAQEMAKDSRKSGTKDNGVFIPLTPEAKMKHSITFNEQNYLCHYGIKGMKWGIRRYQNPDGSLTAAGRARYGDFKTLGKHINEEKKKARVLAGAAATTDRALTRANERVKKYSDKLEARRTKGKDTTRQERKLNAAKESQKEIRNLAETNRDAVKKHYDSLVKEFGKENVNNVVRNEKGEISDGVAKGKAMVASIVGGSVLGGIGTGTLAGLGTYALIDALGNDKNEAVIGVTGAAKSMEKKAYKRAKKYY